MTSVKEYWKKAAIEGLQALARHKGLAEDLVPKEPPVLEVPPNPELGDLALPLFPYAKAFKTSPAKIAEELADLLGPGRLAASSQENSGRVVATGPYINIVLDKAAYLSRLHQAVGHEGDSYGRGSSLAGQKIMIEFSCPNTNKPLHLGHLRNDALGEALSRILALAGAEVRKVNLINDRGIHICKSMIAYQEFGNGATPEGAGKKSDHFVGDYYVKFAQWAAQDPKAEEGARELLRKWEQGDPQTLELWKRMNGWTIEGIKATYRRTGIDFDQYYYESETYTKGREEVLEGLRKGIFYKAEDGSVWVDLEELKLDKKVLLRSDGTSLYLTQDLGTAIARRGDWPFDRLVYIVASEQRYHFQVLFHVLGLLGHPWAGNLYHLSYGMVNLPEGKMKSREGTVVDADDLIEELSAMAEAEIRAKEREEEVGDVAAVAEKVALGAIHYFLLQPSPVKDIVFNPAESLAFTGNTGPYLQYMGARISSILRKYQAVEGQGAFKAGLLSLADEWELAKHLGAFSEAIAAAAQTFNPSLLANYLYELCKIFSRYYHDTPILHNDDKDLVHSRIELTRLVLQTLKNGLGLLNIPFLEVM